MRLSIRYPGSVHGLTPLIICAVGRYASEGHCSRGIYLIAPCMKTQVSPSPWQQLSQHAAGCLQNFDNARKFIISGTPIFAPDAPGLHQRPSGSIRGDNGKPS